MRTRLKRKRRVEGGAAPRGGGWTEPLPFANGSNTSRNTNLFIVIAVAEEEVVAEVAAVVVVVVVVVVGVVEGIIRTWVEPWEWQWLVFALSSLADPWRDLRRRRFIYVLPVSVVQNFDSVSFHRNFMKK